MVKMYETGSLKIPMNRIAVVIGKNGETKNEIERLGQSVIDIDSKTGLVTVYQKKDALKALIALNVVQAIARGFSPEKALTLFNENMQLIVISLKDFAGHNSNRINELRGRVIGRNGRTRQIIEELTNTYISVSGNTVSIIGDFIGIGYSKEAVEMLLLGRKHKTVYSYLEKSVSEIKFKRMEQTFG
ncbi:ribosomal RNA assembly protein [Picrophilus oshimae DSM 9789]|uniref:Ribosomal RNA assembly protein n=2 Tax=Picrophilus oshimae TaxID=46632 RepID=A0A8G2FY12_PICTO|nr:ribosomal RNA assembly protein [Picrophilus oshimae DSM 9789]